MEPILVDQVDLTIDTESLFARLRLPADSPYRPEVMRLVHEAQAIARPKGVYGVAYIEEKGEDHVVIDGIRFDSRVLRVNLEEANRVFPQIATCGVELHQWSESIEDVLFSYWADAIKEMALRAAGTAVNAQLEERFRPGKTSRMSPGSLADWPIRQQRPLFDLFGDVEALIGVRLTDSFLMVPNKSTSGIRFPKEGSFESCQLCPRESCPGRRARFDPTLYEREYGHKA